VREKIVDARACAHARHKLNPAFDNVEVADIDGFHGGLAVDRCIRKDLVLCSLAGTEVTESGPINNTMSQARFARVLVLASPIFLRNIFL
jgi:hypothetical protein